MVSRDYMLKKPSRPSAPKLFIDTRIVPVAVNVMGEAEVALNRVAARIGVRPAVIFVAVVGLGSLGLYRLLSPARRDYPT